MFVNTHYRSISSVPGVFKLNFVRKVVVSLQFYLEIDHSEASVLTHLSAYRLNTKA